LETVDAAVASPLELYGSGLAFHQSVPVLRTRGGAVIRAPFERWLGPVEAADEDVLARARGPVLDVGCGVGRHVAALHEGGRDVLGVDISQTAVCLARRRGLPVVHGDVFGDVPRAGTWQTALLLDENLGIGGCPATLLSRVGELLAPGGRILVELAAPGAAPRSLHLRLELGTRRSAWFPWATVTPEALAAVARDADLDVREEWRYGERWFAALDAA